MATGLAFKCRVGDLLVPAAGFGVNIGPVNENVKTVLSILAMAWIRFGTVTEMISYTAPRRKHSFTYENDSVETVFCVRVGQFRCERHPHTVERYVLGLLFRSS